MRPKGRKAYAYMELAGRKAWMIVDVLPTSISSAGKVGHILTRKFRTWVLYTAL